ncbi:ATP-binding protein [Candidatus Woesearchaeota archaeon]|jgi:uncharacterized protein|nr:ATP-binding protein [Candidatus Woesearchaeota archaeon]MBT4114605.1 ATP-binding protein [Candidatus Woesearchaeota archaeon]MBT4248486.1 ATP-binding protein [Candidatus Woesearchaeota archaeon]
MENIILGRNETDIKTFGEEGAISLGKHYITMEREKSLANPVLLDVNRPHVILVSGKRGSGKSYSLGVIAEGLANLKPELKSNTATIMFDTMGIYWTMKHPNYKEDELVREWGLKPTPLKTRVFVPFGLVEEYESKKLPVDYPLALAPSELETRDWCGLFKIDFNSNAGILIERAVLALKKNFSVDDIIKAIQSDKRATDQDKNLVIARFEAVEKWSLFSNKATKFTDIVAAGETSIIDLSAYNFVEDGQEIKDLVIALFCKHILKKRLLSRKFEEVAKVTRDIKLTKEKMPLVWILIDEAHEFIPEKGDTLATKPIVQLLREGRQPGISMVLATQQPGKIHSDVMTQSDIVLSHRLTARIDVKALNEIMQSYLSFDVENYINNLPRVKGAAIVLDDNSEKIFPIQIQPRISWHGGEDPSIIRKTKKNLLFSKT